ncbi:MAG: glycosyltransferase family 9 protein [Desulfovibrionales bacterium]
MRPPDKIILVHKGALGDFLQAWPSILAIRQTYFKAELLWAGSGTYSCWLGQLGITPCPAIVRKKIDSLYWSGTFPEELEGKRIIWFGLSKNNLAVNNADLWFLFGVRPDIFIPPRDLYLAQLTERGILVPDWTFEWRRLFPSNPDKNENLVLLFPGAGHPMKCWPAVQFFALADWLREIGMDPLFLLGPAERERGMISSVFPSRSPRDMQELHEIIRSASFAVGNDCGPMHLAGYQGLRGLALFGPTCSRRWSPWGMEVTRSEVSCSPCTATASIHCRENTCMEAISLQSVRKRLSDLFEKRSRPSPLGKGRLRQK